MLLTEGVGLTIFEFSGPGGKPRSSWLRRHWHEQPQGSSDTRRRCKIITLCRSSPTEYWYQGQVHLERLHGPRLGQRQAPCFCLRRKKSEQITTGHFLYCILKQQHVFDSRRLLIAYLALHLNLRTHYIMWKQNRINLWPFCK